ncbi:MAG TPA: tetratricopeptide repeat protein [Acidobacteriota bacterium]
MRSLGRTFRLFNFRLRVVALFAILAATGAEGGPQAGTAGKPSGVSTSSDGFAKVVARATAAREQDRIAEALSLYEQALKIRPRWEEGIWYLGTMLYDQDRYDEARDWFRRLVALKPKNAPAWALLGLCEFQTREYPKALADLKRARFLGIRPDDQLASVARFHTAILLTRFEEYEMAYDVLREFARDQNENSSVIEAMGINTLRMPYLPVEVPPDKREQVLLAGRAAFDMAARRVQNARSSFQELVSRYPQAPNVHYAHGVFLLTENSDAALEEFKRELGLNPSHVPAMLQIAFELLKRGSNKDALSFAEDAVRLAPNLFPARNALGRALLETGDVAGAVKQLEAGVDLAPDSPEMRFVLARAYARAGRKDDAARERAEFVRLDRINRTQRLGAHSVGGTEIPSGEKPPGL